MESDLPLNKASVQDGVMTVTLYLHGDPSAFAKALGSLCLAQDMVKQFFQQEAMKDMLKKNKTGILVPGGH